MCSGRCAIPFTHVSLVFRGKSLLLDTAPDCAARQDSMIKSRSHGLFEFISPQLIELVVLLVTGSGWLVFTGRHISFCREGEEGCGVAPAPSLVYHMVRTSPTGGSRNRIDSIRFLDRFYRFQIDFIRFWTDSKYSD